MSDTPTSTEVVETVQSPYVIRIKKGKTWGDIQQWHWEVLEGPIRLVGGAVNSTREAAVEEAQKWIKTSASSVVGWEEIDPATGQALVRAPTPAPDPRASYRPHQQGTFVEYLDEALGWVPVVVRGFDALRQCYRVTSASDPTTAESNGAGRSVWVPRGDVRMADINDYPDGWDEYQ